MNTTIIAWCDYTWNCVHGCSRVSEGCRHCYAERISLTKRLTQKPWTAAHAAENVTVKPHRLRDPYKLKTPSRVFVNSMSDAFHEQIPDSFVAQMFAVMNDLPQHVFQVLTKRPERAAAWAGPWTSNIWMGVSVENRQALSRLNTLRQCAAQVRFVSVEPLLEDLGPLDLAGIHWVIVGGESGPGYRPMDHAWARAVRDQCVAAQVPFFFKQSAASRTEMGTVLLEVDGSATEWRQFPHWAGTVRRVTAAGTVEPWSGAEQLSLLA